MGEPASKQTLNLLTNNCKNAMFELERILPAMMKLRYQLTAIGADEIDKADTILALFSKTEDLFMGSYFILHELMSSLRLLLDTTISYEKRYHIQGVNLGLCEAYNYFSGNKSNGVWILLKPMILVLDNPILHSFITIIDRELTKLRVEYCDRDMRNSTAHFDEPIKRYKSVCSITEEDRYCEGISQFMFIHLHISQISTIIFSIISQIFPKNTIPETKGKIPIFDIKAFTEKSIAEKFLSDERLVHVSGRSLTIVSNSIDSLYEDHLKCERVKEFFVTQNTELPMSARILHQLVLLRMMVAFIRCDLTCAIRAYMNSESSVERSLHLRKIHLIEVSALTHLYGYNKEKKSKSLWNQLMSLDDESSENEPKSLQKKFEELTNQLDCTRRNLYTHFREGEDLNILKRYEAYKDMDHVSEINRSLNLLHLCKKIEDYTMSVISGIEKKEQQKKREKQDYFHTIFEKMRTKIISSKLPEEKKEQAVAMLGEMEKEIAERLI